LRTPEQNTWQFTNDARYVHYTPNETIHGLEFPIIPDVGDVPLIADMTSMILSKPIDVTNYDLIYASAQKNIAPAGLTLVIIREDLLDEALPDTPPVFNFKLQAKYESRVSTPPVFPIYIAGLVFKWLQELGGVSAIGKINLRKANLLYNYLDSSNYYSTEILSDYRSRMNVTFRLPSTELELQFANEAEQVGLANLKGHRLVGGIRASIYNAMPESGVKKLIEFMQNFEKIHSRKAR